MLVVYYVDKYVFVVRNFFMLVLMYLIGYCKDNVVKRVMVKRISIKRENILFWLFYIYCYKEGKKYVNLFIK